MLKIQSQTVLAGTLTALAWLPFTAHADDLWLEGRKVFTEQAQPACGICHTLSETGSSGAIGPNLDDLKPTSTQVASAVRGGLGIMPAFEETLSEEQIEAVAYFIERATND